MANSKKKVLIVVEGPGIDVSLMTRLFDVYALNLDREIVSYNTHIHSLYNVMFKNQDPEDLDLLQILKSREKDQSRKKLFDEKYTDILLIFDMDPHDDQYSHDNIQEMVAYFTESTDTGKLYLNYPMVEAFYLMKDIPDHDYNSYVATLDELKDKSFKSRVNSENRNGDYRKFGATKEECSSVIKQNIEKACKIVGIEHNIKNIPQATVLKAQIKNLKDNEEVFVLSTCGSFISEYNPNLLV